MMLSGKAYNILKWVTLIALPAVGTLYFALSNIWGFPMGEQVVGTINIICTFIGTLIGISTVNYNKDLKDK